MTDCLALAEDGLKHLASDKEKIAMIVKQAKKAEIDEDETEAVVEEKEEELMDQEPIEMEADPEAEKEEDQDDEVDQEDKEDDEEVDLADEESRLLSAEDKTTLLLLKYFKQIKQNCYKRVVQLVSNYVELDYAAFYQRLVPIIKPSIDNLGTKTLAKVPTAFRLLGVWSECELYKRYFFDYPFCFDALVAVINNPNASAVLYIDAFDMIHRLAHFGLTEDNEVEFKISEITLKYLGSEDSKILMKDALTNEEDYFSALGVSLIRKYADQLVDSLANFSNSLGNKSLRLVRASDLKNLNKKISEFALFISSYCTEGESTTKFYEVTKKAWSVEHINKKTSKPFFKIESAQELNAVQKEKEIAANMIKILGNFCAKIKDIEQIFNYYFLPMVARLDDLKLRVHLIECYEKLTENPHFDTLQIDANLMIKLGSLHRLATNLHKTSLDYNKVVDYLIEIGHNFASRSENEKRVIVANCLYWLTVEEMSTREKSLSIINEYIATTDLAIDIEPMSTEIAKDKDFSNKAFYRFMILETVTYFLQSHFGREHVMKYFTAVLRGHCLKCKNEKITENIEFTDLSVLIDEKNSENDFFDLIFNLKLVLRGQAIKVLKKLLKKKGTQFTSNTIKRVFAKIFDYYLYEFWNLSNKEKNRGGSASRLDSVRHILETVFEVYGMLVGQLPFGSFVRFVKDKIFQLNGKSEQYSDTTVKVICSCLNHVSTNLPNVLEKIKAEQEALNEQALKMSVMNRFLDAYKDQKEVASLRMNFDVTLPEAKTEAALKNELAEMNTEPVKEIDFEIDEEEEERIEQAVLSDSQYRVLKLHILGPLKRFLYKKDEKEPTKSCIRPDVAIGIIQIIKLFPNKVFISELIGTLSKICAVLSDRDDERRKTARNTLISMLKVLGPFFLGYFVKELAFHLKRGYEVHIRNYMIYKLIETLVKPVQDDPIKCGQIDYVMPFVAPLLVDEICGDLEEEKEVKEIKTRTIEFRKNKGIESFKLLAQKIDFKGEALSQIIECFKENFLKSSGLHRVKAIYSDARKND